jgi:acid stress chaperone HdeB
VSTREQARGWVCRNVRECAARLKFTLHSAQRMLSQIGVLVALVLAATTADAQVVDLSGIKCRDFIELPKETANAITLWLDGYYTDEEDPAVVDFDKLKGKAEKLSAFCAANPKMSLMTAAENTMAK